MLVCSDITDFLQLTNILSMYFHRSSYRFYKPKTHNFLFFKLFPINSTLTKTTSRFLCSTIVNLYPLFIEKYHRIKCSPHGLLFVFALYSGSYASAISSYLHEIQFPFSSYVVSQHLRLSFAFCMLLPNYFLLLPSGLYFPRMMAPLNGTSVYRCRRHINILMQCMDKFCFAFLLCCLPLHTQGDHHLDQFSVLVFTHP